jgi:hypothetical protein
MQRAVIDVYCSIRQPIVLDAFDTAVDLSFVAFFLQATLNNADINTTLIKTVYMNDLTSNISESDRDWIKHEMLSIATTLDPGRSLLLFIFIVKQRRRYTSMRS